MTLEEQMKAHLDQSITELDANTQARLQGIRRAALNQPAQTSWFKLNNWLPATSLAFCAVIAMIALMPSLQTPSQHVTQQDQTAMLELLENPDELDTLTDPDFLMWVDELAIQNESV